MATDDIQDLNEALALSERRRREAQRLSGVGFWELDHVADTLYWSEEIFAIYGLETDGLQPDYTLFQRLIHDDDRDRVDAAYRDSVASGEEYNLRYRIKAGGGFKWIEARGITLYDETGRPLRSIGTAQDISEIVEAQQALEHLALHDPLTGLPNRKLFSTYLAEEQVAAQQEQNLLAVLFIDLDNFKSINDRHGHDIGDELLVCIARRIIERCQPGEKFARIGGDEFVGLISAAAEADIEAAVVRIKEVIDGNHETRRGVFEITASIGVALWPQDSRETDELLRLADHAMYEAKEQGKSRIRYFDAAKHQSNRTRNQLLQDIERALAEQEFVLHYQPRISLRDGSLAGAEALLRWFRPEGSLPPSRIIQAIAGTPLEWDLDAWVLEHAVRDIRTFRQQGLHGPFSVNFNPSTIESGRLPPLVEHHLRDSGIEGRDLEIEILEVASIGSFDRTRKTLDRCKALGVSFSLDDFGTGYSSLTYFHTLPADKLKIDRGFVERLLSDEGSRALIKSILALAEANGRPVVAEGVETLEVARALRELGCQYGQGFGLARPMAREDYLVWARDWTPEAFLDNIR